MIDFASVYRELIFRAASPAAVRRPDAKQPRQAQVVQRVKERTPVVMPKRTAIILGAKRGGSHILETLHAHGVPIAGIYDQSASAPGIIRARQLGIPVYCGSWGELTRMLTICSIQGAIPYFVFLPTRDRKFIQFASRTLARALSSGFRNYTVLRMDSDFGDYESARKLCSLMGIES